MIGEMGLQLRRCRLELEVVDRQRGVEERHALAADEVLLLELCHTLVDAADERTLLVGERCSLALRLVVSVPWVVIVIALHASIEVP